MSRNSLEILIFLGVVAKVGLSLSRVPHVVCGPKGSLVLCPWSCVLSGCYGEVIASNTTFQSSPGETKCYKTSGLFTC